jgi:NAD(P)H-dependent FMN reductase
MKSTQPIKKIFAISGSLREGSSNHAILRYLKTKTPLSVEFIIYDGLSRIPAFDPGINNDTPPQSVKELRDQLATADGIIICTPEYAFGIPGALKNALDWMVSSGSFVRKPTALITASTGGENAHAALLKVLGAIDASVTEDITLLISFIRSKINHDCIITDAETEQNLQKILNGLLSLID